MNNVSRTIIRFTMINSLITQNTVGNYGIFTRSFSPKKQTPWPWLIIFTPSNCSRGIGRWLSHQLRFIQLPRAAENIDSNFFHFIINKRCCKSKHHNLQTLNFKKLPWPCPCPCPCPSPRQEIPQTRNDKLNTCTTPDHP